MRAPCFAASRTSGSARRKLASRSARTHLSTMPATRTVCPGAGPPAGAGTGAGPASGVGPDQLATDGRVEHLGQRRADAYEGATAEGSTPGAGGETVQGGLD